MSGSGIWHVVIDIAKDVVKDAAAVAILHFVLWLRTRFRVAVVSGKVTDEAGNPIGDVIVGLGNFMALTDNGGNYKFSRIAPGTYDMTFSKAGYETVRL